MKITSLDGYNKIYFIGIGGVSMSGLATILANKNKIISGSDISKSVATNKLEALGIKINYTQVSENIKDIDLIVYTAAISNNNPEIIKAKEISIPLIDRAQLLGLLMRDFKFPISIAGTHGKSTTTSMISEIFINGELNPTITVGGNLNSIGGNLKIGGSDYFVVESCEYFDSFLQFYPHSAVILNIELDHVDYFSNLEAIENSFIKFANNINKDGSLIISNKIKNIKEFYNNVDCNIITFGIGSGDISGKNIRYEKNLLVFDLTYFGNNLGEIKLQVYGNHNIENALAAIGMALSYGINIEVIKNSLENFKGIGRRFEYKGTFNKAKIIDDYAHHPTEIKCTLSAVQNLPHNKIWSIFQPHTFSRTKDLLEDFSKSFDDSDIIILLDIYSAREPYTNEIHSKHLNKLLLERGKESYYFSSFEEAEEYIKNNIEKEDILITMGAGDIYKLGESLLKK